MVGKLAVSLDRMCKGRMALNIVNGWFDEEFRMFGGTVLQGEERYRRTVEFIEILRGLWANETFSYDGQFYKVDKGQLRLKPATPTLPEIYSVSRSDRGRDFIAGHCDWWFVDMPKDTQTVDDTIRVIEANIADMDRRSRRIGRKVRYGFNPFIALGLTQEEALDAVIKRIFACEPNPDVRKIESRMIPATKAGLIGPPEAVLRQLRRYESLGIELSLCKMIPTVENISHIAAEIVAPMKSGTAALPKAS
jgi:FMNH2-dependent dimethyl sulfone monooxygenase